MLHEAHGCDAAFVFCRVQTSPEIKAWMEETGLGSVLDLEAYFEQRVLALAKAAGRSYIVWQVRQWLRFAGVRGRLPA